jgi:hypothetical protein
VLELGLLRLAKARRRRRLAGQHGSVVYQWLDVTSLSLATGTAMVEVTVQVIQWQAVHCQRNCQPECHEKAQARPGLAAAPGPRTQLLPPVWDSDRSTWLCRIFWLTDKAPLNNFDAHHFLSAMELCKIHVSRKVAKSAHPRPLPSRGPKRVLLLVYRNVAQNHHSTINPRSLSPAVGLDADLIRQLRPARQR